MQKRKRRIERGGKWDGENKENRKKKWNGEERRKKEERRKA